MNIKEIFNNRKRPKVLIIGDIMLDTFILGKHLGKSPEGPIPLEKKIKEYSTAGAAALVAECVNKIGGNSFLIGGHGNDFNGTKLNYKIKKNKIKNYIIKSNKSVTITKTRIFSDFKPLLRLDCEEQFKISKEKVIKLKKK